MLRSPRYPNHVPEPGGTAPVTKLVGEAVPFDDMVYIDLVDRNTFQITNIITHERRIINARRAFIENDGGDDGEDPWVFHTPADSDSLEATQVTYFLKKAASIQKGSADPGNISAGRVSIKYVYEIAKMK